mgnify:CR=1 FL=1
MKYLFRENNNEVKVNKVLDLYRKLLNETNNRSKCIMLIVPNATSKLKRIKYRYKWRIKYNYIYQFY